MDASRHHDLRARGRRPEIASMNVFYAIVLGLVVGFLMSYITEYYTAMGRKPVDSIVQKSGTGHATNVIGGLGWHGEHLPAHPGAGRRHLRCLRAWPVSTAWPLRRQA